MPYSVKSRFDFYFGLIGQHGKLIFENSITHGKKVRMFYDFKANIYRVYSSLEYEVGIDNSDMSIDDLKDGDKKHLKAEAIPKADRNLKNAIRGTLGGGSRQDDQRFRYRHKNLRQTGSGAPPQPEPSNAFIRRLITPPTALEVLAAYDSFGV